jgi:hypothetical protein
VPNLGKFAACRRVARTIDLGSAPTATGNGTVFTCGAPYVLSDPLAHASSTSHVSVEPEMDTEPYDERKCDAKALVGMARPMATTDAVAAIKNFFFFRCHSSTSCSQ